LLINNLEKIISYNFKNKDILKEALTHKSTGIEKNYDKLEFLGDRVLGLIIAQKLNILMSNYSVSNIHLKFESLTNEYYLAKIAREITLNKFIIVQDGKDHANFKKNDAILADSLEAIIGGIFIDGGYSKAQIFIEKFFSINKKLTSVNSKSALQEFVLEKGLDLPVYKLLEKKGPDHEPVFIVQVEALNFKSNGIGKSLKIAEFSAAKKILKKLKRI
jgi:ribonuclease-3